MLDFAQIMGRLVVAMLCGSLMGLERETAGKEAGIRTEMLVAAGSALFTVIALHIPYLIALDSQNLSEVIARNSGFVTIIANIVVGIGFLGAGIIMKTTEHIHGLTTAALVWATSSIGILSGLGMFEIAVASTVLLSGTLYLLRHLNISEKVEEVVR